MKKNISIIVLLVVSIFFIINSFITKQENEQLQEILNVQIKGISGMQQEMSAEYYENFKKLRESQCSKTTLDSIWDNSAYLKLYEKSKNKVEQTQTEYPKQNSEN